MPLRVAFFGTPAFAAPTLECLLGSGHEVVGVVTQPDRPRGRGQRVSIGPVKSMAVAAGVPVLQPDRLARDAFYEAFTALQADIGVVAAYGKILPDWLLASPRLGLINVHASLLPRFRGASPIHRAVMAGDSSTGVTMMRVVKALDAGPMLASIEVPIGPNDTTAFVERTLAAAGAALLLTTVDRLADGPVTEVPQEESLVTYAPKLTKAEGLVDWALPAPTIHNHIRGLTPWPRAYTFLGGVRYILHESRVATESAPLDPPGTIMAGPLPHRLIVACGARTSLELREIQLEGKRSMSATAALGLGALRAGASFSHP